MTSSAIFEVLEIHPCAKTHDLSLQRSLLKICQHLLGEGCVCVCVCMCVCVCVLHAVCLIWESVTQRLFANHFKPAWGRASQTLLQGCPLCARPIRLIATTIVIKIIANKNNKSFSTLYYQWFPAKTTRNTLVVDQIGCVTCCNDGDTYTLGNSQDKSV
jgi:hypothetical protein